MFFIQLLPLNATGNTAENNVGMGRFFAESAKLRLRPPDVTLYQFDAVCPVSEGAVQLRGAFAQCNPHECVFNDTALYPCPHDASAISIWAKRIQLSGEVIRLQSPRLKINNVSVLGLPGLKLVPESRAGFLPPVLGWSPAYGLRLGPRVHFPLSSNRYMKAHAAWRTRNGMESSVGISGPNGTAALDYLHQPSRNMLQLKMDEQFSTRVARVALKTHLATNRAVIRELSFFPNERAIRRADSFFRIGVDHRAYSVEQQLNYTQWFPDEIDVSHGGQVHVGAAFFPLLSATHYFQPLVSATLDRYVWSTNLGLENRTRFQLLPVLTIPVRAAIFSGDIRLGALAQRFQTDSTAAGNSRLLPALMVDGGVPLVKKGGRVSHFLRPSATLRFAAFQMGDIPETPMDFYDAASEGAHLKLAIENTLASRYAPYEFSLEPSFHLRSMLSANPPAKAFYGIWAELKRDWLGMTGKVSWQSKNNKFNDATIAVNVNDTGAVGFDTAFFYIAENGYAGEALFPASTEIWPLKFPGNVDDFMLVRHQVRLTLASWIRFLVDAQFELNPGIALSAITYRLEVSTRCRCLTASLVAAHRPERPVPDALLNISWHPGK